MKKMKRAAVTVACAGLLVVGSVAATFAYLQDSSDVVENTFTMGKVDITLDETDVDNSTDGKDRDIANAYKIYPGGSFVKDPIVHVTADDATNDYENCWVFVSVSNGLAGYEADANGKPTIAKQMKDNGWVQLTDAQGNEITGCFYYNGNKKVADTDGIVAPGTDLEVFKNLYIKDNATNIPANATITVQAYAIQADGMPSAAAAWAAANWA